jgi:hypothetical protein
MNQTGSTRTFLATALFVAAFVGTLLLSISATKESRSERKAQPPVAASAVQAIPAPAAATGPELPVDQLLPAEEFADRTWAINELAASPSPESIEALGQVLVSSDDHRERLEAVDALQRLASSGEFAEPAREALRHALADRNAEVAARAQAALAPYETPRN